MKKKFLVMAAVTFSSLLHAQDTSVTKQLDDVIITATKFEQKQNTTGKVVTVIDQSILKNQVGKSVSEILNNEAGVFINGANNNFGSNQDVYLRGSGTGNTLILIDGVPVSDASYINNGFDLNNIAVAQIEKIEILKGAQSTLWGSDAVAGVINIITKKAGDKKVNTNAQIAYGTYNTINANAGMAGRINKFDYNLSGNFTDTKGFSSAHDSTGNANFDRDAFDQHNVQLHLGYQFNDAFSARLFSNYGKYNTSLDAGAFRDDKDYKGVNTNTVNTLDLKYLINKSTIHFTNSIITANRTLLDDSSAAANNKNFFTANYKGRSMASELFGNFPLTKKLSLVAGTQLISQKTNQSFEGYFASFMFPYSGKLSDDSASTRNYAAYASLLLVDQNNFNLEVGGRFNNHSVYGSNSTFTINPSYNVDELTKVFVNISSAFKVPSLYQLYSEYGKTDLNPETSNNYEIGIETFGANKKSSLRFVGFKRDIKNLIVFYTDPTTFASYYINRDEQNDYGFEVESSIAIGNKGSLRSNFTYVDGEGKNKGKKIKNLYRRPNFTMNSVLSLEPINGLTFQPSFRFVGERLKGIFDPGPATQPAYYTLNCYLAYNVEKKIRLFADFKNITNQQYFDVVGYNSRGFNMMAGIGVNF